MTDEVFGRWFDPSLLRSTDGTRQILKELCVDGECSFIREAPVAEFRFMGAQRIVMTIDMKTGIIDLPGDIEQSERVKEFIECVNQMAPNSAVRRENSILKELLSRALNRGISPQDPFRAEILEALK